MPQPAQTVRSVSRRRAWLATALALCAFSLALVLVVGNREPVVRQVSITAGYEGTTRALVGRMLAFELRHHGLEAVVAESEATADELARVDSGDVDFALVSGLFRHRGLPHVREVSPLFSEALHLLVKRELADQVSEGLTNLRGQSVDLGPKGSATAGLAVEVLDFAGLRCAPEPARHACVASNREISELERLADAGDASVMPDAIFHMAAVPSLVAMKLIRCCGYTLVAIPFAEAFRQSALLDDFSTPDTGGTIERRYALEVEIPPFTYQTDPAVPDAPLTTVGARLMLVANDRVSSATVERVLDAIFDSRFARIPQPALHRSLLDLPPRHPLHVGTIAFIGRSRPWLSEDDVNKLANALSVLGALVGGGLFLWQGWRQRLRARRDEIFGGYQMRIAELESRGVELELAAQLALEPLISLQRDLLQLKSEALARYAAGELGSQATLTDLLVPLNAARDHVGALLLHVRENLEEQAEVQGRSAEAVWDEAVERSEDEPRES